MNRLDEPVFMAVPKPMLNEFGIHYRLESCGKVHSPIGLKMTKKKNALLVLHVTTRVR